MKLQLSFAALPLLAVSLCLPCSALSPSPAQQPQKTDPAQAGVPTKTYPMDQLVTATVHDAWELSGRNEEAFFGIVEQLAQFSAQKRGLTLPDTAVAGRRMGAMIKAHAKSDHDQLLYAIVDQAVRTLGTKNVASSTK